MGTVAEVSRQSSAKCSLQCCAEARSIHRPGGAARLRIGAMNSDADSATIHRESQRKRLRQSLVRFCACLGDAEPDSFVCLVPGTAAQTEDRASAMRSALVGQGIIRKQPGASCAGS